MRPKKIITRAVLTFMILFTMTACGNNTPEISTPNPLPTETNDNSENIAGPDNDDILVNNESNADLPKLTKIPVNTKSEDIHIYEKDLVELLSSGVRLRTDGKNLFLLNIIPSPIRNDFYIMPIGTDELYPVDIETPEEMVVAEFAFDVHGRMHLFVGKYDYANEDFEYYIRQLDENYQLNKVIDLSPYVEDNRMPRWFLILEDGTYYIQWAREQGGIIVSSEGALKHKFTRESLGIGQTRQAAIGKNGYIYIVHSYSDEKQEIARLNVDNCIVENVNPALYFPANEIFTAMSGGTDTNLLISSIYSGVWAFDTESGIMENRLSLTDISSGIHSETDFWNKLFLPDGRLLLIGQSENNTDTQKHYVFKYISAGK